LQVKIALLLLELTQRLQLRLRWGSVVARHGVDGYWGIEGACLWRGGIEVLLVRHECSLIGDSSGMLKVLGDEKVEEGLLRRHKHLRYSEIFTRRVCI
jgi:hypothetical protein